MKGILIAIINIFAGILGQENKGLGVLSEHILLDAVNFLGAQVVDKVESLEQKIVDLRVESESLQNRLDCKIELIEDLEGTLLEERESHGKEIRALEADKESLDNVIRKQDEFLHRVAEFLIQNPEQLHDMVGHQCWEAIHEALLGGKKIEAIKALRLVAPFGLKDSKDVVEAYDKVKVPF